MEALSVFEREVLMENAHMSVVSIEEEDARDPLSM